MSGGEKLPLWHCAGQQKDANHPDRLPLSLAATTMKQRLETVKCVTMGRQNCVGPPIQHQKTEPKLNRNQRESVSVDERESCSTRGPVVLFDHYNWHAGTIRTRTVLTRDSMFWGAEELHEMNFGGSIRLQSVLERERCIEYDWGVVSEIKPVRLWNVLEREDDIKDR